MYQPSDVDFQNWKGCLKIKGCVSIFLPLKSDVKKLYSTAILVCHCILFRINLFFCLSVEDKQNWLGGEGERDRKGKGRKYKLINSR